MSQRLRLGPWLVCPESNEIVHGDESLKLEPRVMRVLVYLARHPDEVLSREQILEAVWNGVIVSDEVLTNAIREIRKALGDDAKEPQFIQTIPKQGYRLIAEVTGAPSRKLDLSQRPYPGLAPFSEDEAEFFYGRDEEVEALWGKLIRNPLLALFGPSGAGKSSFLRAGLMRARPEGWHAVICHPGEKPFLALGRMLVSEIDPESTGDTEATQRLLRLDETDADLAVVERWRKSYPEVLLCVDQFEELFTLNPEETQLRFVDLIGRLGQELGIHVLLSVRDDFLIHCGHPVLAPIFKELTLLNPLSGAALRQALVEPAKKCGYGFEDESLVTEMLSELTRERGALPLLAFAAARLWEKRDREKKTLTRSAYLETGGVAGALAQHADATLGRIGPERLQMVREIFRNLVTAQGTRAARDREELLSVFDDRKAAVGVLDELIDARLLTSFEVPGLEGEKPSQRVEIIHESLLTAWPRLVRWQTQDADSARLRGQLRQAAQMWEERGRPVDLVWTRTSFKEFQVWREHYPGGLTNTEEAFAQAMVQHAGRRKRRRRLAVVAALVVAFGIAAITGTLWQRSAIETRRTEAAHLRSLGQLELEERPSAAIAYALASLELNDNPDVRRLALEALWKGPTELWINDESYSGVDFSPNGRWLALGHITDGRIDVFPTNGGEPFVLEDEASQPFVRFFPDSDNLLSWNLSLKMWSIPEGRPVQQIDLGGLGRTGKCFPLEDRTIFLSAKEDWMSVYSLSEAWDRPLLLGRLTVQKTGPMLGAYSVDPSGVWLAHADGSTIYVSPINDLEKSRPLGRHEEQIQSLSFSLDGQRLASVDLSGEIRIWSRTEVDRNPLRIIETGDENLQRVKFDASGSRLVTEGTRGGVTTIWDLTGPPDAEPLFLERRAGGHFFFSDFHPSGHWVVMKSVAYPLDRNYPKIFRGQHGATRGLIFAPDGRWLASSSLNGKFIQWPLSPEAGAHHRVLMEARFGSELAVDPLGRFLIASGRGSPVPALIDLKDGSSRRLEDGRKVENKQIGAAFHVAVGPEGKRIAADSTYSPERRRFIQVWNLETGTVRVLETGELTVRLKFTADGRLISSFSNGDVRSWNVSDGTYEVLLEKSATRFDMTPDERTLVGVWGRRTVVYDLESGSRRELTSHGDRISDVALDPAGRIVVTGDTDGIIRVGPLTGEEPHLLLGHEGRVGFVKVSPKGDWIASGGADRAVRLWPMSDFDKPPFHTLPYEEFLKRLRGWTNLRSVPDEESSAGYRIDIGPFPGWGKVPEW